MDYASHQLLESYKVLKNKQAMVGTALIDSNQHDFIVKTNQPIFFCHIEKPTNAVYPK